jgi:hypothetical protein
MTLTQQLASLVKGDVADDKATRTTYARDTSVLERTPEVVVFPADAADVSAVVGFVRTERENGADISVTARSAGTDMTGGSLTDSIQMVFTKHMNHIGEIVPAHGTDEARATTEPGTISPMWFMCFVKTICIESVSEPPVMSVPAERAVTDISAPFSRSVRTNPTTALTSAASVGNTTTSGVRSKTLVSRA